MTRRAAGRGRVPSRSRGQQPDEEHAPDRTAVVGCEGCWKRSGSLAAVSRKSRQCALLVTAYAAGNTTARDYQVLRT